MRHYWAGCVTLFICNEIRAFVVHDLLEFSCMTAVSPIPDNDRTNMLLPDCFPVTFHLMAWRLMSAATASIATFSPPGNSIDDRGIYLTPPTPICRLRGHGRGFSADFAGAGKAL